MEYTAKAYEALFTDSVEKDDPCETLGHKNVTCYRTQTITSGPVVEVNSFPIWKTRNEASRAREGKKKTREAQAALNERNAKLRVVRRVNATFTQGDLFITLTYAGTLPDEAHARRDIQNYVRKVRAWRKKHGLPEMAYVYVIEFAREGEDRKRIHLHIVMSAMDRDVAEKLWEYGIANSTWLQPDENGLEAVAKYIMKAKKSTRRWACSRNCVEPTVTYSDRKISLRKVERMAAGLPDVAKTIYENAYPNHEFMDVRIRQSAFVAGAYVYARLHTKGADKAVVEWKRKPKEPSHSKDRKASIARDVPPEKPMEEVVEASQSEETAPHDEIRYMLPKESLAFRK